MAQVTKRAQMNQNFDFSKDKIKMIQMGSLKAQKQSKMKKAKENIKSWLLAKGLKSV